MTFETIPRLKAENEQLRKMLECFGVCMSCAYGSAEPCTDCLGTGWDGGRDPFAALDSARALLRRVLEANIAQGVRGAEHPRIRLIYDIQEAVGGQHGD